ncbi:hypothetical protein GI374_14715 [Paracoccus sp. S-4012]|nr:hypothetical protein [Paracoccus sp. S-4012]
MGLQLGVDRPFQTSGQQLQAGQHVSQPFVVEESDGVISIARLTFMDEAGETIDSDASLQIDCNPARNDEAKK